MEKSNNSQTNPNCPKCDSPLGEIIETANGKRLQRCSAGSWNPETKQVDGCDYVKWEKSVPQEIEQECPQCGARLLLATTKNGKKYKKCSTATWDRETRQAGGCDYFEWFNGTQKILDETCPKCEEKLIYTITSNGKKMKKCSTAGWDKERREPTGCDYIEWLKQDFELPGEGENSEVL